MSGHSSSQKYIRVAADIILLVAAICLVSTGITSQLPPFTVILYSVLARGLIGFAGSFFTHLPRVLLVRAVSAGVVSVIVIGLGKEPAGILWFIPIWMCTSLTVDIGLAEESTRTEFKRRLNEGVLCIERFQVWIVLVLGATIWLTLPYFTSSHVGTGDALWYNHMLADFLVQMRNGRFPIFVGETEFAFNGAIFPLRAAPYFQYLGGLVDMATRHRLSFYSVQHATLIISIGGSVLSFFWCTNRLRPGNRILVSLCAILYATCPGLLSLGYGYDLQMSVMTLPWLPLVAFAHVQSFETKKVSTMLILGCALAVLWYAHSPIAAWVLLFSAIIQGVRLLRRPSDKSAWKQIGVLALVFSALSAFAFVSLALTQQNASSVVPFSIGVTSIIIVIQQQFAASLLPVSQTAAQLGDFQLGWSLWAGTLFSIGCWIRAKAMPAGLLLACGLFLFVTLIPVPGLNHFIWFKALPRSLVNITYTWPMFRFYAIMAAFFTTALALQLVRYVEHRPNHRIAVLLMVTAGVVWSCTQAQLFVRRGFATRLDAAQSVLWQRSENLNLSQSSYGLFPKKPSYVIFGPMDAYAENRLLAKNDFRVIASNFSVPSSAPWHEFSMGQPEGQYYRLTPELILAPGKRYLVEFKFDDRADYTGVIRFTGQHTFRQYQLPKAGEESAFGVFPTNEHALSMWTTSDQSENVTVWFIPSDLAAAHPTKIFSSFRLYEVEDATRPVVVSSLSPYQARVSAAQPSWLESPRMFIAGYRATVNSAEVNVSRSPEGLAMIPVPAGTSQVVLTYRAPTILYMAAALSGLSWIFLLVLQLWRKKSLLVRTK